MKTKKKVWKIAGIILAALLVLAPQVLASLEDWRRSSGPGRIQKIK